jgi:3-dehydroquinate dehydratase-2
MARILLINGPNLGQLGLREPEVYGSTTLPDIEALLERQAKALGVELVTFQSDAEHALIERVHAAREQVDFILLNPAAFTHTSIALRDALLSVKIPFIEIHLSNVAARETFRHKSYFADIAVGTVAGFGVTSYELALTAAIRWLSREED